MGERIFTPKDILAALHYHEDPCVPRLSTLDKVVLAETTDASKPRCPPDADAGSDKGRDPEMEQFSRDEDWKSAIILLQGELKKVVKSVEDKFQANEERIEELVQRIDANTRAEASISTALASFTQNVDTMTVRCV